MADQVLTKQKLTNADEDLGDLEEVLNGPPGKLIKTRLGREVYTLASVPQINTMTREEVVVALAPKANQDDVDAALSNLSTAANKFYPTLAAATADIANIYANQPVTVGEVANGGLWYKATSGATTLSKSPYDPLIQAEKSLSELTEHQKSEKLFSWVDANNIPVMYLDASGKLWIKGLSVDAVSLLAGVVNAVYVGEGENLFVIKDGNNIPIFKISKNGDVFLPRIGILTEYIESRVNSKPAQQSNSIYSSARDTDHALSFSLQNFEKQQVLITATEVNDSGVFDHVVTKIRIPAITRIQKNQYLCFFEARESDNDFGRNSQGVVTITVDPSTFEATTSNLQALHLAELKAGTSTYYTFMNACAVKLDSGRIITLYVKRNGTNEHYLYKRYSDDDGLTWSAYEDIGATYLNMSFYNLLCPCSQGLVKRFGENKGRIIFPVWYSTTSYSIPNFRAGYIYSDDGGATWHDGAFAQDLLAGNEVQCCEDVSGDLIFNIRLEAGNMGGGSTDPSLHVNKFVRLKDGTLDKFTIIETPKLTDNQVMGGLIQGRNVYDGRSAKIQFAIAKTLRRQNMTVYTSYDGCKTWYEYNIPNTTGVDNKAAYACIESFSIDKNFVLWEADSSNQLETSIISLKNLIGD